MSLNYEMKSNLNDAVVDEFLNSQTKEGTFKSYKTVMKQYLEFTKKTGQQLIDEKKADTTFQVENSMLNYRKHILSKGKSENYAVGSIMTIRGFYSYYRMQLMFRKNDSRKLTAKNRTTRFFIRQRRFSENGFSWKSQGTLCFACWQKCWIESK